MKQKYLGSMIWKIGILLLLSLSISILWLLLLLLLLLLCDGGEQLSVLYYPMHASTESLTRIIASFLD